MWAGSSVELDKRLLAVRISLLKGLLGQRVFIIREGDQNRFDTISTPTKLSKLQVEMGRFWGQPKCLERLGYWLLPVLSIKFVRYAR